MMQNRVYANQSKIYHYDQCNLAQVYVFQVNQRCNYLAKHNRISMMHRERERNDDKGFIVVRSQTYIHFSRASTLSSTMLRQLHRYTPNYIHNLCFDTVVQSHRSSPLTPNFFLQWFNHKDLILFTTQFSSYKQEHLPIDLIFSQEEQTPLWGRVRHGHPRTGVRHAKNCVLIFLYFISRTRQLFQLEKSIKIIIKKREGRRL